MDPQLINQYMEEFKDQTVTLDHYMLTKIGLLQKHTFLKVQDFYIYCVPIQIGLHSCKLLAVLSKKETQFLSKYKLQRHSLRMRFLSNLFSKEISLFLNCYIKDFKKSEAGGAHSFIDIDFRNPPQNFLEILIDLFLRIQSHKKRYEAENQITIAGKDLKRIFVNRVAELKTGPDTKRIQIARISSNALTGFIKKDIELSSEKNPYNLLLYWNKVAISLKVNLKSINENDSLPDAKIAHFEIPFSANLSELLLPIINFIEMEQLKSTKQTELEG